MNVLDALDAVRSQMGVEDSDDLPESSAPEESIEAYEKWEIPLNQVQRVVFENRSAKYYLLHGERASGKTICALHMLVDHCWNTYNALGLIITRVTSMAEEGGAWHKFQYDVLPIWRDAIGLEYTEAKYHATSRKPYVWIKNRFGGWSKAFFHSLPVDAHVYGKIKGMEPSFVLIDEAQTMDSDEYFSAVVQQIGRRQDAPFQPIVYCANPAGTSHWLYKRFFEIPVNQETGAINPDYAVYHLPFTDNERNLPEGYWDRVIEATRSDQVEYDRMVRGIWRDRPEGRSIFSGTFNAERHVVGDAAKGMGLMPVKDVGAIVGYDLGPAHSSITMMQLVPTKEKWIWLVFDEINLVGAFAPYREVVPKILERIDYWDGRCGPFRWSHISDSNAFTHIHQDGSFDVRIVEDLSDGRIVMMPAPKGRNSIVERTRSVMELLTRDEILMSATCTETIQMFLNIPHEKPKRGVFDDTSHMKPRRSRYVHPFDSLSYPIITYRTNLVPHISTGKTDRSVIKFGR